MSTIFCERCGEKLNPKTAVMLDLNTYTLEYSSKPWPTKESQGGFYFGPDCAKKVDVARKGKETAGSQESLNLKKRTQGRRAKKESK